MTLTISSGISSILERFPNLTNKCKDDPIFILSAGWRSGSTLLQRLIMPSCFIWGEPFGHSGLIESLAGPLRCFNDRWPFPQFFYQGEEPTTLADQWISNLYPSVQDLLSAHQSFFRALFADPVRRQGIGRWGLKEVRLSADHAAYLKWLFPQAKFLFLVRNPYDAWRSYSAVEAGGWRWYYRWPDDPVTLSRFARNWRELAGDFIKNHQKVDGILVRYEDIARGDLAAVEDYLGVPLSREILCRDPRGNLPVPRASLSDSDCVALESEVGSVVAELGYGREATAG